MSIDLQTLAAIVTIIGGLIAAVFALILGPLQIAETILEIYKKMIELRERHKSSKPNA